MIAPTFRLPQVRLALAALSLVLAAGCGGRDIRVEGGTGPRLTSERLGEVRNALTYDGDWMGGIPAEDALVEALELARRRGVDQLIDLRPLDARGRLSLGPTADQLSMGLVEVDRNAAGGSLQDLTFEISDAAVDEVRRMLREPGRPSVLLVDDDGTLGASVYVVYLAADRGLGAAEAQSVARSSGLSDADLAFIARQIERIGISASSGTR